MTVYSGFSELSGNGTAKGTVVTAANDTDAGNVVLDSGSTIDYVVTNSMQTKFAQVGFDFPASETNQVSYFTLTRTASPVTLLRAYYVPQGTPLNDDAIVVQRSSGSSVGFLRHRPAGTLQMGNSSNSIITAQVTPALVDKHMYQIDILWKRGTSASNGRSIFMVTDLDSNTWADGGVFYHDTGDTISTGTTDLDGLRVGKTTGVQRPGFNYSYIAWTGTTTIPAQASANTDMSIGRQLLLPPKYGFFLWNGTSEEPLDLQEGNSSDSPLYISPNFEVAIAPVELYGFTVNGAASQTGYGLSGWGTEEGYGSV